MDLTGLITLGSAIFGHATSPDAPKIAPFEPVPIEKRDLSEYLPEIDSLMSSQADMALSMMSGELPQGVIDQIKSFAGEKAVQGGFSASTGRTGNLVARDLGLSALDLMERGQGYANYLVNQTRSLMADDIAIDVSNANMAYDAWASQAQIRMDEWRGEADRYGNLVSGIAGGASQLATSYQLDKNRTEDARQFDALITALS